MIKKKSLLTICIISAVVFFGGSNHPGEKENKPADSPVALVKKIVKDVNYRTAIDKSDWELAKTGQPLYDGGEVKTGVKSLALILFSDGSGLIRVRENSILHIYGKTEDKRLNKDAFLEKGLIGFDVTKQEEEEFKLSTPTVVASIRGTNGFFDYMDHDSTTVLFVNDGDVDFIHTGSGKNGSVSSGMAAIITSNGSITYDSTSSSYKNKYNYSQTTNSREVIIKTKKGDIKIKFYSNDNK